MVLVTKCSSYESFERAFHCDIHPSGIGSVTHDYPEDHNKDYSFFGTLKKGRIRIVPIRRGGITAPLFVVFRGKVVPGNGGRMLVRGYLTYSMPIWIIAALFLLLIFGVGGLSSLIRYGAILLAVLLVTFLFASKYRAAVASLLQNMKDPLH